MLPVEYYSKSVVFFFSFKDINLTKQNPNIKAIMKIWWPWSCVKVELRSGNHLLCIFIFLFPGGNSCLKIRYIFCAECLLSMSIQELAFQASLESLLSSCSKIVNDAHKWRKNEMYDFWLTEALLEFSISDTPSLFSPRLKAFVTTLSPCIYLQHFIL